MQMHGYGMHFSSHLSAELHHVYPGQEGILNARLVVLGTVELPFLLLALVFVLLLCRQDNGAMLRWLT